MCLAFHSFKEYTYIYMIYIHIQGILYTSLIRMFYDIVLSSCTWLRVPFLLFLITALLRKSINCCSNCGIYDLIKHKFLYLYPPPSIALFWLRIFPSLLLLLVLISHFSFLFDVYAFLSTKRVERQRGAGKRWGERT